MRTGSILLQLQDGPQRDEADLAAVFTSLRLSLSLMSQSFKVRIIPPLCNPSPSSSLLCYFLLKTELTILYRCVQVLPQRISTTATLQIPSILALSGRSHNQIRMLVFLIQELPICHSSINQIHPQFLTWYSK